MSQQQPESPEPTSSAPEAANAPDEIPTTIIPRTPGPAEVPVTPAAFPGASAKAPGPDWRQVSLGWMQKSQEITAKLLYDLGGWIFGGLIVVNLMLLQALISLGFADRALLIAGLAGVLAFPFNLAGLGVIRYFNALSQAVEDAQKVLAQNGNLDAETLIKLTRDSAALPPDKHRVMDSSVSLALYLSVLFTVIGLCSALWHISWAVTLLLIVAGVLAALLVLRVIRHS